MNSERINRAIANADLSAFDFDPALETEIVAYVQANAEYMHEVTADMVTKVAELAFLCPEEREWVRAADMVVLTHQGRIRKLLNQ